MEVFSKHKTPGVFKPGDIMVSLRNINMVLVFDPHWKLKYRMSHEFVRQHNPDFMDGNRISVYDNHNTRPLSQAGRSRILVKSVDSGKMEVVFRGTEKKPFFSNIMGKHQWLDNGNLLVTESSNGRALEISPQGKTVWEVNNLVEPGWAGIMEEAERLPGSYDRNFFLTARHQCRQKEIDTQKTPPHFKIKTKEECMKKIFTFFISMLLLATFPGCDGADSGCGQPAPETVIVTGPVTGGNDIIWSASVVNLDEYGYTEKEYFYEGDAISYKLLGEAAEDGKWDVEESDKTPFKSRMLVRLPDDPSKFNGTVIVEWFNVSGGADGDPGFMYTSQEILREGYAWVGVSAQQVGIQGGGFSMMGNLVQPLVKWDPERYGSLSHPGDAYSYDMFTIAGRIVKGDGSIDVLEGLTPERLIAYGESQSAMMMVSYVDGVHPLAKVFDGFFIHSRGARVMPVGKSREEEEEKDSAAAAGCGGGCGNSTSIFEGAVPSKIRDDLDSHTKVFEFQTEGDVLGEHGYHAVRQPDSDTHHCWEVAGASHADKYILEMNTNNPMAADIPIVETCAASANNGPHHLVIKAALHALHEWMINGTNPPTADPLQTDAEGNAVLDEHGNALGGIRTPHVDVPVATLKTDMEVVTVNSGCGGGGLSEMICGVFGETVPFSDEKLNGLYESHEDYVGKVTASANEAQTAGFLLAPEVQSIIEDAQAEEIPPKDF